MASTLRTHSLKIPRNLAFAGLLATILFSGCGGKKDWEITHATAGTVTYKGNPVSNAELAFYPEDEKAPDSVRPKAKSTDDGKFQAWTYTQGDGIPAGNYKVTVVHHEVTVSKGTIVAKPNSLPPKYGKKDSTDIKVQIVAGKNDLPAIELK